MHASAYILKALCLEAKESGFSLSGRRLIVRAKPPFLTEYQSKQLNPHKVAHKKINDINNMVNLFLYRKNSNNAVVNIFENRGMNILWNQEELEQIMKNIENLS